MVEAARSPPRSLQRRLLAWVLGALILGGLLLGWALYEVLLTELNEQFDDSLKQVALATAEHFRFDEPAGSLGLRQLPPQPRIFEEDGDFEHLTVVWTRDGRRLWTSDGTADLPFTPRGGIGLLPSASGQWHVYTLPRPEGVIQVAQRVSSRATLAAATAGQMLAPLVLVIALTGWLLVLALRRGLAPLDAAAHNIAMRRAASLHPIDGQDMPAEIQPLVGSMNDMLARLSAVFEQQRHFIADAAHELRSPLTALKLQLQLLQRGTDRAERAQSLAELASGMDRMQRLIEQLLQLSRLEADPQADPEAARDTAASQADTDLCGLARDVLQQARPLADAFGIVLQPLAAPPSPVVVRGDAAELQVLLRNLVHNALLHCPRGSQVEVLVEDGAEVRLRVRDDGPGIAPHERERVFDRFHRGAEASAVQGSGLGLAIVKAIAQRHGARLSLQDNPAARGPGAGRGLEVLLLFPR